MARSTLILLVAGKGHRLAPFTDHTPKALIEFGGVTITEMAISQLAPYIDLVVMVIGYEAKRIKKHFGILCGGIPIGYVENTAYERTGAASSLLLASRLGALRRGQTIVMEGDHLLHPDLLPRLASHRCMNGLLVDDSVSPEFGEETVVLAKDGVVKSLVWPASNVPKDQRKEVIGEAITAFKLSSSSSLALSRRLGAGEIIKPINEVIKHRTFRWISTGGLPWIEIDTEDDLARAQTIWAEIKKSIVEKGD